MEKLDNLEKVKQTDGWKYLSERSDNFEELVDKFLYDANTFVNSKVFHLYENNYPNIINYHSFNKGDKTVVFSYLSNPIDRDLDCQFKIYRKIIFSIKDDKLTINKLTGRLESKYGYNFDNEKGGVLKTSYEYQEYTKEGIELLYRVYNDKFVLDGKQFWEVNNIEECICSKYNPQLDKYDGKRAYCNGYFGKTPRILERSRSLDNLGLVQVTTAFFDKNGNARKNTLDYHLNTFFGLRLDTDPFLIHINSGILPIVQLKDNGLKVNYLECGTTLNNFDKVALVRFKEELMDKINELDTEINKTSDVYQVEKLREVQNKCKFLYYKRMPKNDTIVFSSENRPTK